MGTQLSAELCRRVGWLLVFTLLEVSQNEERFVALHLAIEPLKTRSGLEPVPRCEPSIYQPITR